MSLSANWGNIFIVASLFITLVSLMLVLMTAFGKESYAVTSRILYLLASACIFTSLVLLLYYFISCDYRFVYVYENSSRDLSLPYRIAAVWAGKEGSFLLWLFFLNVFGMLIIRSKGKNIPIVSVIVILTQLFILVLLIVESPFLFIWDKHPDIFSSGLFPGDGLGLNPLLRDPWMVAHPPVLFLGYASAVVPFAHACAGLYYKDRDWIQASYPWIIFSMTSLGVGIFLGGYWAYTVLGWGGYWGWDSVENSSLIPWIIAVALMHGLVIQKRTGMLVRANLFLALFYFMLVLYSTWLTRSGVLSNFSVHSFAASKVSPFLMVFLSTCFLCSMVLFIMRFKSMKGDSVPIPIMDWRTLTVYGIIMLALYAMIIMIGTSLPLISSAFMERASSVTVDFYNNFSKPFGVLILLLMVLSTAAVISKNLFTLDIAALGIVSVVLGIIINAGFTANPAAYVFATISFFLLTRSILDLVKTKSKSIIPSRLAHIGVGLMVLGIITSNFHTTMVQKKLVKDIEYDLGMLRITFTGLKEGKESSLAFNTQRNSKKVSIETAYYLDNKTESLYKEPYVFAGFVNDLYIAPEIYESGVDAATQLMLSKGEEKEISGIKVRFNEFRTEHMTSGEPVTFAELTVNGVKLAPGIQFTRDAIKHTDRHLPGTDRAVSLREIDATSKRIVIFITPGKSTVIPPDTVIITISKKRLIWLVWLGTILISIAGCYTFARSIAGRKD
jgi:cytochrome c-type biogenesis protein CcmF